jgi:hypothetical protein
LKNILLTVLLFSIFNIELKSQNISIQFKNLFNNESINFGKKYITTLGDTVAFSNLQYYISNIKFIRSDGERYIIPQDSSYFLLNHADTSTLKIPLSVSNGNYIGIEFTIGVDSLRNTMDASKRTGNLDVGNKARGMYWVWNSGYIFFKLEGKTVSNSGLKPTNFRYHIGGYGGYDTKTINNIKNRSLIFNSPLIIGNITNTININVSVDQFFNSITPIRVREHPSVMWTIFSSTIANNYEPIFNLGDN